MINSITHKFEGVKRSANGYAAKCPAHIDKVQSLSIKDDGQRILLHCFAGCRSEDILKAAGLEWKHLFHDTGQTEQEREPRPFDGTSGVTFTKKEIAVYQYRDESGNLLYENVRYDPKEFRQRQIGPDGQPIFNLNGVRRVPYRLQQLLPCVRQRKDVWLCEGEKDAEALAELNLTASSFKNWRPEFNKYIRDTKVIIVMDHDKPGEKQAQDAARMIARSVESVKVLDVFADRPMPAKHGPDISDYIYQCRREEDFGPVEITERLCQMADRCDEWKDPAIPQRNLFRVKTAGEWLQDAKSTPAPKMLFGEFWFEGELCILFADTNVGKSILAVQIGDAISRGRSFSISDTGDTGDSDVSPVSPVSGCLSVECGPQKIIYFDFELTEKQFESRFSERAADSIHYIGHYEFHENFMRAEIDPDNTDISGFGNFEAYLSYSLEATIKETGARKLIIDNLTYLRDETENARNALPLMKYLKELKSRYGLSILTLAHTPKRDSSKPLSRNDLQGSKMLINFCDSSFAIGESTREPGLRYIKQIKARNTEVIYHTANVLLARIRKNGNFLGFEFTGTGIEFDHLKAHENLGKTELAKQIRELTDQGLSQRQIAAKLKIAQPTVLRYQKKAA